MEKLTNNELKELNKAQLISLLNQIDREKHSAYAEKVQSFIQSEDILSQHFVKKESSNSIKGFFKDALPPWSHLVLAGLLFLLAVYVQITGIIPVLGIEMEDGGTNYTKFSFVVILIGSGVLSIVHYFQDRKK